MAEIQTIIGSLPVLRGEYDGETSYYRDNQVTMFGSTFQSVADDNVGNPPAEERDDGKVYAINTDKWIIVANALAAYNAGKRIDDLAENTEIKDEEGAVVATPFRYIQNEEFIFAKVDAEDKLLFGIHWDGTPEFGKTSAVEDRLQSQVTLLAERVATIMGDEDTTNVIDTMNELKKFFAEIENTETLTGILANLDNVANNLDKTTIKDEAGEIQDTPFKIIENEEFLKAIADSNDKVLFGFRRATGKPYYPLNEMYHVIQNKEYFAAWVTTDDKVVLGLRRDGEIIGEIHAVNALKQVISQLQSDVAALQEKVGTIDTNLKELLDVFSLQNNEEYLAVEQDTEGKMIGYIAPDGSHYLYKVKSETIPTEFEHIKDPEGRTEITTDAEGKVLSKRDSTGVLQEYVGIKTPFINIETINGQKAEDWRSTKAFLIPREYDLPKYGHVIMSKELSYIYDSVNYAPKDIAKVENKYYVKDSLVDGAVVETSKEVSIIENDINLSSWTVDKTTKHYLKVDIDFGTYLKGTFFIETKYQGNSTLFYDKKNFRYTFYEDILFTKKKSIKIGELISAKKFNLKAYWRDKSLLREHACYRIVQAIRETRPYTEQYPWNKEYNINTCATGITNGFPIRIDVGKSFQGVYWFGLAKDINNFMLSDKKYNGVLIQGDGGYSDKTFWQVLNATEWSDLLGDIDNNIGENSLPAVEAFYRFLNTDFDKETASEYLNINNWIDCIIILQFFGAIDMLGSNMILYAGADKKVFSPMYYDMDWTWGFRCKSDVSTFDSQNFADKSIWIKIQKVFWEEICNRYSELRKLVLNDSFIDSLLNKISRQIPYSDYEKEMETWQDVPFQGNEKDEGRYGTINDMVTWEKERIEFMDKYFKIKK